MRRHLTYIKYILRHKWYVLKACRLVGASLWRGLVHDMSKFLPSEWFPYAEAFYEKDGTKRYSPSEEFDYAWLKHIHRNPHHHQYWVLRNDSSKVEVLEMPRQYMLEMVADWIGAGQAIKGKIDVWDWYQKNRDKMLLHTNTRLDVENIIYNLRIKLSKNGDPFDYLLNGDDSKR